MNEMTYRLVVDLGVRGSLAPAMEKVGARAGALDGAFKKIGESAGALATGIERIGDKIAKITATAATLAGGAAFAGIAYGVTHLNNELEQTHLSLGAIFNAQGAASGMADGVRMATETVREMRKDAAKLPGEFQDLLGFMRLGATPGLQAGASVKDLEKLSANAMAAAAATGVQMDQGAREFAQLLQGRSGAHNVFGTMLGLSGARAEEFNKASGQDRLKTLTTELGKFHDAIDYYGQGFDALQSTLRDNAKQALIRATAPLFESVKTQLGAANKWFDTHQEEVERFADKVGVKLSYAFDVGVTTVKEWYPSLRTFAENAYEEIASVWKRVEPLVEKVGEKVQTALADPDTMKRIERSAMLWGAVKVGNMAAPTVGGIGKLAGSLGGGAELGAALGPLAIGLVAAAGAAHVLSDETNVFHDTAMHSMENIRARGGEAFEHLSATAERLEPIAIKAADAMGTVLLFSLETTVTMFEKAASVFDGLTSAIGGALDTLEQKVNYFTGLSFHSLNPESDQVKVEREFFPMSLHAMSALASDLEEKNGPRSKTGAGGGGGGTHIQKVEIVVSSNQDPSRIARLTAERFQDMARYPTSSRYTKNFTPTQ